LQNVNNVEFWLPHKILIHHNYIYCQKVTDEEESSGNLATMSNILEIITEHKN
jgi:hypothetical protein